MDAREFARQIGLAWSTLSGTLNIGRLVLSNRSLEVDAVFREIVLSDESSYEEIFRTGLSRSNYNILLKDYSFFQFTFESESSWRLGYFPNPWLSGVRSAERQLEEWEALEELGAFSHEDISEFLSEMPYLGAIPPIRFEYAPNQYRELAHPAAHFHIGRHAENRWPSAIALGPLSFTLQIAKMYYPDAWQRVSRVCGASVEDCIDEDFISRVADVRVVHEFSERERRSFHFGKNMTQAAAPESIVQRVKRRVNLGRRLIDLSE